jgi:chromosome segregation protein
VHLRSIEIQGFKTFAKKTELLFEPGITAVVGPNGSGKSNLVDAIRWVLGERSARELRGSKMEEIVYSGGARRPASGMAEVRLVIDNSDGRLPVPFQEVEVLRRGYRSGESEFRLNGARCRLRDIEELFASTGLTQQGYSVVAQDDVDHIIQTSAGERRALIEEAAGVRGLRSKRDDALARIRESDATVLRLRDLAGELGPRVEELRRQAETARAEAELSARLDSLRGSLLRGEWLAARQQVKKAGARVAGLEAAVAAARAEAEFAAAEHAAQRERLARAHEARLARERELGTLRLAATEASSRLALLAERIDASGRATGTAQAALASARSRQQALEAELMAAREEAASAVDGPAASAPDPELEGARERLSALREERAAVQAAVVTLREEKARSAGRVAELEQHRDGVAAAGEDLAAELARAETELRVEEVSTTEVAPAEAGARQAALRLEAALAAQEQAERAVEADRAAERAATSSLQRLEERARALRSLAADGDLPAPSASRLVDLLERGPVRAAAIAAGIDEATLHAWLEEGRTEGRAIARALQQCLADAEKVEADVLARRNAVDRAEAALAGARSAVDEARQVHLTALGGVSAAAARDNARAQRIDVARHRAERLRVAVGQRAEELGRLSLRLAEAVSEAQAAAERAAAGEPGLEEATQAETAAAERVEELQRRADQREARRVALVARAGALAARAARAEAQLTTQTAEVEACVARIGELAASHRALEQEWAEAEALQAAALTSLQSVPQDPAAVEVDALTARLLVLEKANLEGQVALAHHQDALAAGLALLAEQETALADLRSRLGAEGEADPGEEDLDWEKTQREIARIERHVIQLGPVNPLAIEEFERDHQRLSAIDGQLGDLERAREGLVTLSEQLSAEIDRRFEAVFGAVAYNFQETFATLFVNGRATLRLDDPQAEEPGVDILAQPAGKRMRGIRLLSGGERALTALAFILALEKVNPSPFYIFDEVDAPLDDANVRRFNAMLESMASDNQFILITHNHQTMTCAQALYGVTLEDSGVSRVVSVRLREGRVVTLPVARSV